MAIEFDITAVENKLKAFTTKAEKSNYLNEYLFKLKKQLSEFNTTDNTELSRLVKKTERDYELYKNEFDNGKLVYWYEENTNTSSVWNKRIAQRIGIADHKLLVKRITLETEKSFLSGRIQLFESLIERVKNENSLPLQTIETSQLQIAETTNTMESNSNELLTESINTGLSPFKENMAKWDYSNLSKALQAYFNTGKFPVLDKKISVTGKINIKEFGWALTQIFRKNKAANTPLPYEYLQFAKRNISLFTKTKFQKKDFRKSNLYSYFMSKTH